jgi:hypothetical protein
MPAQAKVASELQTCIEDCLRCYRTCRQTAMDHCLETGGPHVEPEHFRLMVACAEACRSAADIMLIGVPLHRSVCRACAEICEACARSCEPLDGMEECVRVCRACAESCFAMAADETTRSAKSGKSGRATARGH